MIINIESGRDRGFLVQLVNTVKEYDNEVPSMGNYPERIERDKTWGLTSGCFDLFHHLHIHYLERCRRLCDYLVVGIDSDRLVQEIKGPDRPINSEYSRAVNVGSLECVSVVFIMDKVADFEWMSYLVKPQSIFKNEDFDPSKVAGARWAGEVITVPDIKQGSSTSEIIEKIVSQEK